MLWITGKNGMLGQAFCRLLKEKGIDFVATGREVDICSPVVDFDFDVVINCAAYTAVDSAEKEWEEAYRVNRDGPRALGSLGKRVVHFSTDYVFDGEGDRPYLEGDTVGPRSVYGMTKLAGERALLEVCPEALIIRTSWLFGREGVDFVDKILRAENPVVVDDQWGRPTFCDDLVEATLALLGQSGVFHVANGGEATWYDFARAVREVGRKETEEESIRPRYSVLATKKIEGVGVKMRHWTEALACVVS